MDDAASLAPQLAGLGISHLYLSPILRSTRASTHGYDAVDPTRVDDERGGEEAFERLRLACLEHGLGLVLDVVPNHLAVGSLENPWWASVLRLGPASPWADSFDIHWDAPDADGKVILPVLGAQLDDEIARGALSLERDAGELRARYFDHTWPVRPATAGRLLRSAFEEWPEPTRSAIRELADRFERLEGERPADDPEAGALVAEGLLERVCARDEALAGALDHELSRRSEPDRIRPILDEQHYRPMFWRDGARRLNYRRFFDIDTLAGVRVEDPEVFEATHAKLIELAGRDGVDGLRIDHPDGLRDPRGYFDRLAARAPEAWIVAEKILHPDEDLRDDWSVAGTTGYDALNDALGVLIDPEAEQSLTRLYAEITGADEAFERVEHDAKRHAASEMLVADLARLTGLARAALHSETQATGALGSEPLGDALVELAACVEVYRTYLVPERGEIVGEDERLLRDAAHRAAENRPALSPDPLGRLVEILLDPTGAPGDAGAAAELCARFQQFTAPAAAKGVEDTALYRYNRFAALNDVGGHPGRFGLEPGRFHDRMRARAQRWPAGMLTTSTHDTKRSEDVRARLAVLSEIPDRWADRSRAWLKGMGELGFDGVHANDRYLLVQTLVGAWAIDGERARAYMTKALREAKQRTSWTERDSEYESRVDALVDAVLSDRSMSESIGGFVGEIRGPGRIKSLAQVMLKLTCPGAPDVYQGCELWDLSLVDPDNRRPVDFALRRDLCARLEDMSLAGIWASIHKVDDPGVAKLWLTRTALGVRGREPRAFAPGSGYEPIVVECDAGAARAPALAYARTDDGGQPRVLVVVPRWSMRPHGEARIELPEAPNRAWINVCTGAAHTGGRRDVRDLLGVAPVALLVPEGSEP